MVYIVVIHCLSMRYLRTWTVEELREVIALLQRPTFNPAEVDDDLHKRILRTVHIMIDSFDIREAP